MRRTPQFESFNASQRHALDTCRNLAVRANAGSGKTSVVVERIVQLLAKSWDEGAPLELSFIVAITFTRKAAAELQERLAESFRQLFSATCETSERAYWDARISELPRAMVGTIDSFCARILREFGLVARGCERIEPDFEPLEGYEEEVLKREAINRVINQLSCLSPDRGESEQKAQVEACRRWAVEEGYDAMAAHLETLLNHSLDPETILAAHQDLPAATQRVAEAWAALPVVRRLQRERDSLLGQLRELERAIAACKRPSTSLTDLQAGIHSVLNGLQACAPRSDEAALRALATALLTETGTPRKRGLAAVATQVIPLQETWGPLLQQLDFDFEGEVHAQEAADRLVTLLAAVHAEYLKLCRLHNRFDFLTLARRTRDLLRNHPEIRQRLKQRWRYLMVDEFQDTNQLQWEILSWIAGSGPDGPLDADRLFLVGDPQQSIYRFRHADVAVFTHVQEHIRASNQQHGHAQRPSLYDPLAEGSPSNEHQRLGLMPLAENYRSLFPMPLSLMDRVFRHVFDPQVHGLDPTQYTFEVLYQPLQAGLQVINPKAVGEVRYVIPGEQAEEEAEADGTAGEPDEQAPAGDALGRLQVRAVVDQLIEIHGRPKYTARPGESPTLAWKDMAVLLPSRSTVLIELEKEFRRRRVPFVVTKGIGFWQRQEIRDVTNLATCLADTGDELAFFAVLRSPLGQLSDAEILFLSQLGQGSLLRGLHYVQLAGEDLSVPAVSEPADQEYARERWRTLPLPVQAALSRVWQEFPDRSKARLRRTAARLGGRPPGSWRQRVDRMAHADLLQRCLEESGAYAIYAADGDGESMLANLERLFDRIRVEERQSVPGLARLARWLRQHMEDSLKEEQAGLAPGTDAVQIMTVHAAKGLEFPVVAVMKMERKVDRHSYARLLVKNAGDRLLPGDEGLLAEPPPGTVVIKVRHPRRPREIYAPCLFRALQRLDRAQQLAESRRLFYVAATRAKERLILAGRLPSRPGRLPLSWQRWFEEALGITEEHLAKNVWHDPAQAHVVQILTGVSAGDPIAETKPTSPQPRFALQYIHERPLTPTIATTSLEQMRETWKSKRWEWWLKYRVQLDAQVSLPTIAPGSAAPDSGGGQLGTAVGTLVHRLFEMPAAFQSERHEAFRKLLEAMAAGLLSPSPLEDAGEEASPVLADPEAVRAVAETVERIWQRVHKPTARQVRVLLEAPGETEVPFVLKLGRWQISGRYDKLLASNGGFEIVDWKTDKVNDPEIIARRHEPQMRLYALALHRAGRAALVEGKVRVHLAMLHPLLVKPLIFSLGDLEIFANELAHELHQMDAYEPD
jgi:ATP-dependent helicase/nuclease subunit A